MVTNKSLSTRQAVIATAVALGSFATSAIASETRGFAVSWFYPAAYSQDGDCPDGLNPSSDVLIRRILTDTGREPAEVDRLMAKFTSDETRNVVRARGTLNGQPANIYREPESVPDSHIRLAKGRYAYGFNLDGKGSTDVDSLEDPDTHEKGIDNQLSKALGCFSAARATDKTRPASHATLWELPSGTTVAWLVEVSGIDDAQNDDDVTVSITRATGPIIRNAAGEVMPDVTFTADTNPNTQNVAHGKIVNGVLTTAPFEFHMIHDPLYMPIITFKEARLRMVFQPDGSVRAIIGGYHPWVQPWTFWAHMGTPAEIQSAVDVPGLYYAIKKLADAYPDPTTGQNTAISATYRIDAVPAFVVHPATTAQIK